MEAVRGFVVLGSVHRPFNGYSDFVYNDDLYFGILRLSLNHTLTHFGEVTMLMLLLSPCL